MARKSLLFLVIGVLCSVPLVAGDEMTLDDLLARHHEAMGGLDERKAVKSARLSGKMTMGPGMEAPITMVFKRPLKSRMEFTVQGMTGITAYDGKTAWMVMPFMGKPEPEEMTDEQARSIQEQADFDGPLVDWRDKGHQVELVGREEVDGTDAYKIKVTMKGGDVRYNYLDSETFTIVKQEGKTIVQGNEVEFEAILSDYKKVGGLMYPHSIQNRPKGAPGGQTITIESIELDGDVSDDVFAMPEKKVEEPAAAGE